jgi:hypothetical protein
MELQTDQLKQLAELGKRGETATSSLQVYRLLQAKLEQNLQEAQSTTRDAERELQYVQKEIQAAGFHDVGHLLSYLEGDGNKYQPKKEHNG